MAAFTSGNTDEFHRSLQCNHPADWMENESSWTQRQAPVDAANQMVCLPVVELHLTREQSYEKHRRRNISPPQILAHMLCTEPPIASIKSTQDSIQLWSGRSPTASPFAHSEFRHTNSTSLAKLDRRNRKVHRNSSFVRELVISLNGRRFLRTQIPRGFAK